MPHSGPLASCCPQFIRHVLTVLITGVVSEAAALLGRSIWGLKTYTAGDGLFRLPRGGLTCPAVVVFACLLNLSRGRSRALGSTRQLAMDRRVNFRVGIRGHGSLPLVRPT
ncbi:hypothetical protein EDB84DRAFT_316548 [Lactarius hengduanensis]|nr:hypothetical protein EDB84DRAFT_316548 [Lactarius hengduanensis]